jgi:hypothetical protein
MATAKAAAPKAPGAGAAGNSPAKIGTRDLTDRVHVTELRKPLYASVGAGDLAVEKLRGVPTIYNRRVKDLRGSVREIPHQVRGSINEIQGKATSVYGELAQRGERLLSNIRNQPGPAGPAEKATKSTVRRPVRPATRRAVKPAGTTAGAPAVTSAETPDKPAPAAD